MHKEIREVVVRIAAALAVACSINAYATSALGGGIHVSLQDNKTSLLPYEPLMVNVVLTNTADRIEVTIPGRWVESLALEIREQKDQAWQPIARWWRPELNMPPLPRRTLAPKASVCAQLAVYPFAANGDPMLTSGKVYVVRAVLHDAETSRIDASAEITMEIRSPQAEPDNKALSEIKASKALQYYLLPEQVASEKYPQGAEHTLRFIGRYSESQYAKYFKATLVKLSSQDGVRVASGAEIERFRSDLATDAPWLLH